MNLREDDLPSTAALCLHVDEARIVQGKSTTSAMQHRHRALDRRVTRWLDGDAPKASLNRRRKCPSDMCMPRAAVHLRDRSTRRQSAQTHGKRLIGTEPDPVFAQASEPDPVLRAVCGVR